jgi:hypothetical protein
VAEDQRTAFAFDAPFVSVEKGDEQKLWMVLYEPYVVDSQGDFATPEEIEKMLHGYMEHHQEFNVEHKGTLRKVKLIEGYIARNDFGWNGQHIVKGTAIVGIQVLDSELWQDIKSGEFTGCSIEGKGKRTETPLNLEPGDRVRAA